MAKIRVLVVDDSVVVRRMISDVINSDADLELAGTAPNGRIALAKLPQVNPDVVILDVEMPEMDGLQTLAGIRQNYPRLPVIMFSTLTQRGATVTLDALTGGATDYVTKPANVGSVSEGLQCLRDQLVPKIKLFCGKVSPRAAVFARPSVMLRPPVPRMPSIETQRIDVVAIGVSTGGPNALAQLLPTLPGDFPVPVLIVQHMPPLFTRLLAERLAAKSALAVREAVAGEAYTRGQVWIAPGGSHLVVSRIGSLLRMRLNQDPPQNSCRPSVDVLFRSVAEAHGANVLGVVLTGMGQDGLRGCERIREAGGQVLVQDEASSVVWGMPGFVARAGLADKELPLEQLGPEIVRRVTKGRSKMALA